MCGKLGFWLRSSVKIVNCIRNYLTEVVRLSHSVNLTSGTECDNYERKRDTYMNFVKVHSMYGAQNRAPIHICGWYLATDWSEVIVT